MKTNKFLLVVNDWPMEGCRKVKPFETHEEASKAGLEFLSLHVSSENKLMIIYGEILDILVGPDEVERN